MKKYRHLQDINFKDGEAALDHYKNNEMEGLDFIDNVIDKLKQQGILSGKCVVEAPRDTINKMKGVKMDMVRDSTEENSTLSKQLGCEIVIYKNGFTFYIKEKR